MNFIKGNNCIAQIIIKIFKTNFEYHTITAQES